MVTRLCLPAWTLIAALALFGSCAMLQSWVVVQWYGHAAAELNVEDCARAMREPQNPGAATVRMAHITQCGLRALLEQAERDDESAVIAKRALIALRIEIDK